MEKLQPIIKQMFWILFGMALILILWAWWAASTNLSAAITEGHDKVEKSYQESKQNVESVPNPRWTEGAAKENAIHLVAYTESGHGLWQQQLKARVYPQKISKELSVIEYGSTIERDIRGEFAKLYRRYFNEQLETLQPFSQGDGLVEVNYSGITQEDENRWRTKTPTSREIWEAQEDIWLLRSIYDAIAEVNSGAENIEKATIRSVQQLELRGGDPDAEPGAAGGGGGGFSSDGGDDYMGAPPGDYGDASGGGAATATGPWAAYQGNSSGDLLVEEFGAAAAAAGGGFSGGGGPESMMMPGDDSSGGFDSQGTASTKRYVDDSEELPYKTRAFILQVRMVQQRIPSLLAALTNSSFPVEIVRVDASFGSPVASSPSGGMGDMGGMGDSGPEGMDAYGGGGGNPFGSGAGFGGFGGDGGYGGAGAAFGGPRRGLAAKNGKTKPPDPRKSGFYATAMADPNLSTVRVAGLMTLYESREEKEAIEDAEQVAETEAQDTEGVDLPDTPAEVGGDTVPTTDVESTTDGEPAMENPPADGSQTPATPAAPPDGQSVPEGGTSGVPTSANPDAATKADPTAAAPGPDETPQTANQ